jgi:hypothetical protein
MDMAFSALETCFDTIWPYSKFRDQFRLFQILQIIVLKRLGSDFVLLGRYVTVQK